MRDDDAVRQGPGERSDTAGPGPSEAVRHRRRTGAPVAAGAIAIAVAIAAGACGARSNDRVAERAQPVSPGPEAATVVAAAPSIELTPTVPVPIPSLPPAVTPTVTSERENLAQTQSRSPSPWPEAFELFDRLQARMNELGFEGQWHRTPYTLSGQFAAVDDWDERAPVVVTIHDSADPDIDAPPAGPRDASIAAVDCGAARVTVAEVAPGSWGTRELTDLSEALAADDCGRDRALEHGVFRSADQPIDLDVERVLLARFDMAKHARLGADGVVRFENWQHGAQRFLYDMAAAEAGRWPFAEIGDPHFNDRRLPPGISAGTSVLDWPGVEVVNQPDGVVISRVVVVPGTSIRLGTRPLDPVDILGDGPGDRWVVDAIDDGVDEFVDAVRDPTAYYFTGPPIFGPDGIVVWGMYSELGAVLYAARLTDNGHLVDLGQVHVESVSPLAPGEVHASWYGFTDDGHLLAIGSQHAPSHNGGSNGHLPNHGRVDLAGSPRWVASGGTVDLDIAPITVLDEGTAWYVGSDLTPHETGCGPRTLFLATPDGPVRLTEAGVGFATIGEPIGFTVEPRWHRSQWRAFAVTCTDAPDRVYIALAGVTGGRFVSFQVSRCPVLSLDGLEPPGPFWDIGPPPVAVAVTSLSGESQLLGHPRDLLPLVRDWLTGADCPEHGFIAATGTDRLVFVDAASAALAEFGLALEPVDPVGVDGPLRIEAELIEPQQPVLSVVVRAGRDGLRELSAQHHVLTVSDAGRAIITPGRDDDARGPAPAPIVHTWCGPHLATLTSIGGEGTPFAVDELVRFADALAPTCDALAS